MSQMSRSWTMRLHAWLTRIRNSFTAHTPAEVKLCSVVYLPQSASCMDGRLCFSIPPDFRVVRNQGGQLVFSGNRCGLTLTVMQMPFEGSLRHLTQVDLQRAFVSQQIGITVKQFARGYVRHAPRVTVHYTYPQGTAAMDSVAILIQKRDVVYNLLFTGAVERNLPVIEAMEMTLELP